MTEESQTVIKATTLDWITTAPTPRFTHSDKIEWTLDQNLMFEILSLPTVEAAQEACASRRTTNPGRQIDVAGLRNDNSDTQS